MARAADLESRKCPFAPTNRRQEIHVRKLLKKALKKKQEYDLMAKGYLVSLYNSRGNKVASIPKKNNIYGRFDFEEMSLADLSDELLNQELNISFRPYVRIQNLHSMNIR